MYESFRVQNFRGFEDLRLDDLARVNLIAGKNNTGKTSLLEALFIFMNPYNPELFFRVNIRRGLRRVKIGRDNAFAPFTSIFRDFDSSQKIRLRGLHSTSGKYDFEIEGMFDTNTYGDIEYYESSNFQAAMSAAPSKMITFMITDIQKDETEAATIQIEEKKIGFKPQNESRHQTHFFGSTTRESFENLAEWYSNFVADEGNDLLLNTLKTIDSRLESIQLLYQAGEPIIFGNIGGDKLIPIVLMGDGMVKMLQYILAMTNSRNGILLIDEIENGLHHSVQEDVWTAIAEAAENFNVQVFATTHSREMAMAAHRAFENRDEYDFRYHRLDRDDTTGKIEPTTYSELGMNAAMKTGTEVR